MDIRSQTPEIFSKINQVQGSDLVKEVNGVKQILKSVFKTTEITN